MSRRKNKGAWKPPLAPDQIVSLDLLFGFSGFRDNPSATTTVHLTGNADGPPTGLRTLLRMSIILQTQMGGVILGYVAKTSDGSSYIAVPGYVSPEHDTWIREQLKAVS